MIFLPYGSSSGSGWLVAHTGSLMFHAMVFAISLGGLQNLLALTTPEPEAQPSFTVTLERLDSDTIAGLIEQDGEAASDDADGVDPATPETLQDAPPDQVAAIAPTDSIEPVAETPESIAPEAIDGATNEPETLAPVAVEPVTAAPAPTSPLIPETITALPTPQALAPIAPEGTAALITNPDDKEAIEIAPGVRDTETLQPIRPAGSQPVSVAGQRDAPSASSLTAQPAPTAQDLAVGDLLRRIRAAPPEPCLLALPRRDGEDGVGLALIANSDRAMARFVDAVMTAADADIRQTRTLVDERQCAAITYVRDNIDYPATRLGIRVDRSEVLSGERLTGVLRGTAGRYVTLLLVDNNGVVQDLQRFMSFSGNFARFDVPVTRAGPSRDTEQMLLAIATRRPTGVIRDRAGRLAQDVFAGLNGEVATGAALAVTTFDVR